METCEVKEPVYRAGLALLGFEVCADPAYALFAWQCARGHRREGWVCLDHMPVPGEVGCWECWRAGIGQPVAAWLVRWASA
jgi:hypothetical protein